MKIAKTIFFSIVALIMILCAGILVCAMTPSLTEALAEKVAEITSEEPEDAASVPSGWENGAGDPGLSDGDSGQDSAEQRDDLSEETDPGQAGNGGDSSPTGADSMEPEDSTDSAAGEAQPGISADLIRDGNQTGYEPPDSGDVEAPASVSGRTGYEPVQEEAEQILPEEAKDLEESAGNTGSDYSFDPEIYPYYAMLETDMRALYNQIYANALDRAERFAPVTDVNVSQVKTVFEAVYNDHPELFWLETGYSCKYLRSGKCVEITLKYNRTAENLEQAKSEFEGRAGEILSGTESLGDIVEKERYVHDQLMQSVEYDLSAPMNQSAYSALVEGKSVCAGYARAFQYLMQQLGIPCYYCTGFAGEDHAWNIIKLEDGYYNVDVTWDDTDTPTYDYFNKSDREYASSHIRTGLSLYLPACQSDGSGGENLQDGTDGTENPSQESVAELVNPNPTQPLVWESRIPDTEPTKEEQRQESLERAGVSETDIRNTMQEYYDDCRKLLEEVGTGDKQFTNVIPESLWSSVERAYYNGEYWNGYVEDALKTLGADDFVIQLQVESIGSGYYRLYHNVYTD